MYKPSETVYFSIPVQNATGAATNADSLPTAVVWRNGSIDAAVTPTVSNTGTGAYKGSFTLPSGYAEGDTVVVKAQATVGGVQGPPVTVLQFVTVAGRVGLNGSALTQVGLADGAITSAKIATDAIGSDELAASALTEIQSGLATSSGVNAAATSILNAVDAVPTAAEVRQEIDSNSTQLAAIKAKTDNLPASPAAGGEGLTTDQALQLATVYQRLSTVSVAVTSPVLNARGDVELVIGDDYFTADGRAWSYTLNGSTLQASDVTSSKLTIGSPSFFDEVDGTPTDGEDGLILTFDLPAAKTGVVPEGRHRYYIVVNLAGPHRTTQIVGYVEAIEGATPPAE